MEVDPDETILEGELLQIVNSSQTSDTLETHGASPSALNGLNNLFKIDSGLSPVIPTFSVYDMCKKRTSTPTPGATSIISFVNDTESSVGGDSQFSEVLVPTSHLLQTPSHSSITSKGNERTEKSEDDSLPFDFSHTDLVCSEVTDSQAELAVFHTHPRSTFKVPAPVKVPVTVVGSAKSSPSAGMNMTAEPECSSSTMIAPGGEESLSPINEEKLEKSQSEDDGDTIDVCGRLASDERDVTPDMNDSVISDTQVSEISVSLLPQEPMRFPKPLPLEGILSKALLTQKYVSLSSPTASQASQPEDPTKKAKCVTWHDSVEKDGASSKSSQSSSDMLSPRILRKHEQECNILHKIETQLQKANAAIGGTTEMDKDVAFKILKPFKPLLDQIHKTQMREAESLAERLKEKVERAEKRELHSRFKLLRERQQMLVSIYQVVKNVTEKANKSNVVTRSGAEKGATPEKRKVATQGGNGGESKHGSGNTVRPHVGKPVNPESNKPSASHSGDAAWPPTGSLSPPSFSLSPPGSLPDITELLNSPGVRETPTMSSQPAAETKHKRPFQPPPKKRQKPGDVSGACVVQAAGQRYLRSMLAGTGGKPVSTDRSTNMSSIVAPASSVPSTAALSAPLRQASREEELMINNLISCVEGSLGQPVERAIEGARTSVGQKSHGIPLTGKPLVSRNTLPGGTCRSVNLQRSSAVLLQSPPTKLRAPSLAESSPESCVSNHRARRSNRKPHANMSSGRMTIQSANASPASQLPTVANNSLPLPAECRGTMRYPSLKTLIDCGTLRPGNNVLSLLAQNKTYTASLSPHGFIRSAGGDLFPTPLKWCASILSSSPNGSSIKSNQTAYQRVLYKGVPLKAFSLSSGNVSRLPQDQGHLNVSNPKPLNAACNGKLEKYTKPSGGWKGSGAERSSEELSVLLAGCDTVCLTNASHYRPLHDVLPGYTWDPADWAKYEIPQKVIDEVDAW